MDVAYELSPLVAYKLIAYTFGALLHLFLMVLIVGQRRLGRLEWLLFWLVAVLFMWNSGNLLALNVGLFYGVGPRILEGSARLIPLVGLILIPPLMVELHAEYASQFLSPKMAFRLTAAAVVLPVAAAPWAIGRALGHLDWDAVRALHPLARPLVVWLAAALLVSAAFNLRCRRGSEDPHRTSFHDRLAALQVALALGLTLAYVVRPLPVSGLGGYLPATLMLLASAPAALLTYAIFRYNLLDLRLQRNVTYSIVAIFALLLYINVIRRVSGFLELHGILPSAVTEAVMIFILVVFLEPVRKLIDRALYATFVSEMEPVQRLAADIQENAKQGGDVRSVQRFVEKHAAGELRLKRVSLRLAANGGSPPVCPEDDDIRRLRTFSIRRGEHTLGYLDVVPFPPGLSGDQSGSVQLLADQMAAALELCQLIADKVQLERALAARERMAFLGEMATRIAHNVKNPLSSMKTVVQLLEEDSSLPERVREDCRLVTGEIDRLNRNISQVLRYAKPARDTDRPADLTAVMTRILTVSRAGAERRGVQLHFHATGACPVQGGEEALTDILSNLVVNALEASPEGGNVRVRLVRAECALDQVALSVEDEGPGIAPELREKIFQPFFTTRPGGTGLGLAIVTRRTEEIGGSVECLSPIGPQGGTRFVVRFRAAV